jgi:hypothetical protein
MRGDRWPLWQIQRAARGADRAGSDPEISRRRRQVAMTKQKLDRSDVCPSLEQMNGKGVAERMRRDWL